MTKSGIEAEFLERYEKAGGERLREEERIELEDRLLASYDEATAESLRRLLPARRSPVDSDPFAPSPTRRSAVGGR